MEPRLLDLFSGVGGFSLAFEGAGFDTAAFSEVEPFPCRVLAERWPGVPNFGDVSKIAPGQLNALGQIDVVTFGSPCQDWSVAGKRLGLEGHRSGLFHEAIRVIRIAKPRFALFENVPGLFSSASGWDFAAVLDEMAESGALDIAWSVLDAQWFGVPQRRRRIFVVADFRGERAGEILSLSKGVCRDTPPSREAGKAVAALSANGVGANGADDNQGQGGHLLAQAFALRGREEGARVELSGDRINSIKGEGGSGRDYVSVRGEGVDSALTPEGHDASEDGSSRGTPTVGFYSTGGTHGVSPVEDGCPALKQGTGLDIPSPPAVAVNTTGYQGDRVMHSDGTWSSLAAQNANNGGGAGGLLHHRMAVRRLTPLECERLQGFPDGWTDIPAKLASDSARYRAMGNAVAVPVVEWIAKRMRGELA